MIDNVQTQTKWVSSFNIEDVVRHKLSEPSEKYIIVEVCFSKNGTQYKLSNRDSEIWKYEHELIRVI